MNTYVVDKDRDGVLGLVIADYFFVDDRDYLSFYRRIVDDDEIEVALFKSWVSVVIMDEVESKDIVEDTI